MQFAIYCLDKPDHTEVRASNRPAHAEHLKAHNDHLLLAGPLLSEDGATMIGSLLVVEMADRAAVDRFIAADPYTKANLFQSVAVRPFRKVFPQ
ncbi:MAG: YciI family protein [Rhodospirillaceae bacterium]|nr:MAG: YciI family protein [Rhodospirillaceae bacterium]